MSMEPSWRSGWTTALLGRVKIVSSPEPRSVHAATGIVGGSYMQRFGQAKAELLRRAASEGSLPPDAQADVERFLGTDPSALSGFLADYYRDLEFPDLAERSPDNLVGAAVAHLRAAVD